MYLLRTAGEGYFGGRAVAGGSGGEHVASRTADLLSSRDSAVSRGPRGYGYGALRLPQVALEIQILFVYLPVFLNFFWFLLHLWNSPMLDIH